MLNTKLANDESTESSQSDLAAAKAKPSAKQEKKASESRSPEFVGDYYCQKLTNHIHDKRGQFLQDDDGNLFVVIDGRRISLTTDKNNFALNALMLQACSVTTIERAAQIGIQRLQVAAYKSASNLRLRRFSALSQDRKRLYLPTTDGMLLQITIQGVEKVPNCDNDDKFWVEHPNNEPLSYSPVDIKAELANFERLVVDTQACEQPEMRWLVAMNEGLFPFVRELCPSRFILVHQGSTQQGKTSGAERFTRLHGLGAVHGDTSIAALGNMGDIGLLVMDNKEQANLTQPFIDYLLFLSTGAARSRSTTDGVVRSSNKTRPVAVITTIEGVWKDELEARCVAVTYKVSGQKIPRAQIEDEIVERRHAIGSALAHVLQQFLQTRSEHRPSPNPRPSFEEHFTALCDLLRAFAVLAGKPRGWAEEIIEGWNRSIAELATNGDDSELEYPIRSLFENAYDLHLTPRVTHEGRTGILYVTEWGALLTRLRSLKLPTPLPNNPGGLSRRLRGSTFNSFTVLDENNAPELAQLKRTANRRPIGIFIYCSDAVTLNDGKPLEASSSAK